MANKGLRCLTMPYGVSSWLDTEAARLKLWPWRVLSAALLAFRSLPPEKREQWYTATNRIGNGWITVEQTGREGMEEEVSFDSVKASFPSSGGGAAVVGSCASHHGAQGVDDEQPANS